MTCFELLKTAASSDQQKRATVVNDEYQENPIVNITIAMNNLLPDKDYLLVSFQFKMFEVKTNKYLRVTAIHLYQNSNSTPEQQKVYKRCYGEISPSCLQGRSFQNI